MSHNGCPKCGAKISGGKTCNSCGAVSDEPVSYWPISDNEFSRHAQSEWTVLISVVSPSRYLGRGSAAIALIVAMEGHFLWEVTTCSSVEG